jgi:endonuclease/exonuclease/phosphatase family metal-dependent hydrolase
VRLRFAIGLVLLVACSDAGLTKAPPSPPPFDGGPTDAGVGLDASGDVAAPQPSNLRVLAGNLSSGAASTYDSGESIRLLEGLAPDVALLQEFNYGGNAESDVRAFVDAAFGSTFVFAREEAVQIPNAIVSRFPIITSGRWVDPYVANRGFVYAKIQVPGAHPLWAVSVHFLTTGGAARANEATSLVAQLGTVVAAGDYVVIGGDLNTENRTEACITTLGRYVATSAPYPVDQQGNDNTNSPRSRPYDWVLVDPTLLARRVPTTFGTNVFVSGLVFDSRVYVPLSTVAPITVGDSAATNMQHMPVVEDFFLE